MRLLYYYPIYPNVCITLGKDLLIQYTVCTYVQCEFAVAQSSDGNILMFSRVYNVVVVFSEYGHAGEAQGNIYKVLLCGMNTVPYHLLQLKYIECGLPLYAFMCIT